MPVDSLGNLIGGAGSLQLWIWNVGDAKPTLLFEPDKTTPMRGGGSVWRDDHGWIAQRETPGDPQHPTLIEFLKGAPGEWIPTTLDPHGANSLYGGGGNWLATLASPMGTRGVLRGVDYPRVPADDAAWGVVGMARDGSFLLNSFHDAGTRFYDPEGHYLGFGVPRGALFTICAPGLAICKLGKQVALLDTREAGGGTVIATSGGAHDERWPQLVYRAPDGQVWIGSTSTPYGVILHRAETPDRGYVLLPPKHDAWALDGWIDSAGRYCLTYFRGQGQHAEDAVRMAPFRLGDGEEPFASAEPVQVPAVPVPTPTPTPAPADPPPAESQEPAPMPEPAPVPTSFDFAEVISTPDGGDARRFPRTAQMIDCYYSNDTLVTRHDFTGHWPPLDVGPDGAAVEGNQWFLVRRGDRWVAGVNEWIRPGQTGKLIPEKELYRQDGGSGVFYDKNRFGDLFEWAPVVGEIVGVFCTTPARTGVQTTLLARTNVVFLRVQADRSWAPVSVEDGAATKPGPGPGPEPTTEPPGPGPGPTSPVTLDMIFAALSLVHGQLADLQTYVQTLAKTAGPMLDKLVDHAEQPVPVPVLPPPPVYTGAFKVLGQTVTVTLTPKADE